MSNIVISQTQMIVAPEKVQLVKDQILKGASDSELELFIATCNRTGLDPFARQCWGIKRWDASLGKEVYSFQTSVDGFRVIANRSGVYAGQVGPFWCGPDGVWKDVWLDNLPPVAAKIGVLRADFKEPLWAVAKFHSYAARKKDGNLTPFWFKMPELMIAKVAECLALRKAFPQDLSGIYSKEEMDQVDEKDVSPNQSPGNPISPVIPSIPPTSPTDGPKYQLAGASAKDYERMERLKKETKPAQVQPEPEQQGPLITESEPVIFEVDVKEKAGLHKIPEQCFKIYKHHFVKNIPEKDAKGYVETIKKWMESNGKPLSAEVAECVAAIEIFWEL